MRHAAQRKHGFSVKRLNGRDAHGQWIDRVVVEDHNATPAEVATTRLDFKAWLGTLSPRNREIARLLATGESTGETAKRFGVSAGRVSQLRGELRDGWWRFQGEPTCCGS